MFQANKKPKSHTNLLAVCFCSRKQNFKLNNSDKPDYGRVQKVQHTRPGLDLFGLFREEPTQIARTRKGKSRTAREGLGDIIILRPSVRPSVRTYTSFAKHHKPTTSALLCVLSPATAMGMRATPYRRPICLSGQQERKPSRME